MSPLPENWTNSPIPSHKHIWVVFSSIHTLPMGLNIVTHGTVDKPTQEEWNRASYAPEIPYPWLEESRVIIHYEKPISIKYVKKEIMGRDE